MPVIMVQTPIEVHFDIRKEPDSGWFVGTIREYPGFVSQGRTLRSVQRKLEAELKHTAKNHPEELGLFR
jgi:predicted RNase H-like HicB family nuclease